eukprot:5921060-Pleurochrysis_carterae.AAC.1
MEPIHVECAWLGHSLYSFAIMVAITAILAFSVLKLVVASFTRRLQPSRGETAMVFLQTPLVLLHCIYLPLLLTPRRPPWRSAALVVLFLICCGLFRRREDKRLLQKARALEAMLQLQSLCAPDRRVARRRLKQLLTNTCRKLEELVATAAGVHGDAILQQENARRIAEVVRGLKVKGDCLQNTREARDQELNEVTSILSTICPAVAQPDSTPRQ